MIKSLLCLLRILRIVVWTPTMDYSIGKQTLIQAITLAMFCSVGMLVAGVPGFAYGAIAWSIFSLVAVSAFVMTAIVRQSRVELKG